MGNSLTKRPEYALDVPLTTGLSEVLPATSTDATDSSLPATAPENVGIITFPEGGSVRNPAYLSELVHRCEIALQQARAYKGCSHNIRRTYKETDNVELLCTTFKAVLANAVMIRDWHVLSMEVSRALGQLCAGVFHLDAENHCMKLLAPPEIVSAAADIAVFAVEFDMCKCRTPDIQNDFSWYKREAGSSRMNSMYADVDQGGRYGLGPQLLSSGGGGGGGGGAGLVSSAVAGVVSMWVADMYPMTRQLKALFNTSSTTTSNTSDSYNSTNASVNANVVGSGDPHQVPAMETLGYVANIIGSMFTRNAVPKAATFAHLRAMVCCAVVYDVLVSPVMFGTGCSSPVRGAVDQGQGAGAGSSSSSTPGAAADGWPASIFVAGSLVKTTKLLSIVQARATAAQRASLFNAIKYCSATYLSKGGNKAKIAKMMDS